ncbi:M64 family metallopeptidase [Marinilabiliaceae bacterium ANBcel2]|nr:M64 family metallopeptidase [Marinilabiliaceae bacterium ANBcel2]
MNRDIMRNTFFLLLFLFLILLISPIWGLVNQNGELFIDKTLRVDMVFTGDDNSQSAYISDLRWYNRATLNPVQFLSPFDFGEYRYMLISKNGDTLFKRGFSTLFEEWRSTSVARDKSRAFQQTLLMPFPGKKVKLVVEGRDSQGLFYPLISEVVNCESRPISMSTYNQYPLKTVHGDDLKDNYFDLLFVAEGYREEEMSKFYDDARRMKKALLSVSPYSRYRDRIRIKALALPSKDKGVDDPVNGKWANSVLSSSYNILGIDRYLNSFKVWDLYDYVLPLKFDHVAILVNSEKYGGGGIYNYFSIVAAGHRDAETVLVHELGHGMAGLGDEYFEDEVSYENFINLEIEPWYPNLTTLVDFNKKWTSLIDEKTPVPTPDVPAYRNVTGLFEGGGYVSEGVYRPSFDCLMRRNSADGFCEVCSNIIEEKILFYSSGEN